MKEILDVTYILLLTFLVYSGFSVANIVFGVLNSVKVRKEAFDWKILLKGVGKVLVIFLAVSLVVYSCIGLPHLNMETSKIIGEPLFSDSVMDSISVIGILSALATAIVNRGQAAIKNVTSYFGNKED